MSDIDLGQPVELVIRGDRIDILGFVAAMNIAFNDRDTPIDDVVNDRSGRMGMDIIDQIKQTENFGMFERELKRAVRNGEEPEFRGIAVDYREFDPQHPEPSGPKVDLLPDLDDVDRYTVITYQEDEGFQAAGWPEYFDDVVEAMAFASFLRQFARDMEQATEPGVDDEAAMEAMGDG